MMCYACIALHRWFVNPYKMAGLKSWQRFTAHSNVYETLESFVFPSGNLLCWPVRNRFSRKEVMQSTPPIEKMHKPERMERTKRADSKRDKWSARQQHQQARRRAACHETRQEGFRGVW